MANTLFFFMSPEDEVAFLRSLETQKLEVYPEVCDPSFEPFAACADNASLLTEEAYYLALPAAGDMMLRQVKRGPHAGMLELDEITSPVFHFERCQMVDGELRSGKLWVELEMVGDRQHQLRKPDLLRSVFEHIRSQFKKSFRRSNPTGFFVGPTAARKAKAGLKLREAGRKGELVVPYK